VLLVVTAATAAYVLSQNGTIAVVVVQMLLSAVPVIFSQQRKAAARARLADAHAELRAATSRLGALSRTGERTQPGHEVSRSLELSGCPVGGFRNLWCRQGASGAMRCSRQ
jgi:hypothetical protein